MGEHIGNWKYAEDNGGLIGTDKNWETFPLGVAWQILDARDKGKETVTFKWPEKDSAADFTLDFKEGKLTWKKSDSKEIKMFVVMESNEPSKAAIPFGRPSKWNTGGWFASRVSGELEIPRMSRYIGKAPIFESPETKDLWTLAKAGKSGGLESGGALCGEYTTDGGRAFVKRDKSFEPQIAEVLASKLMNDLFPDSAVVCELLWPVSNSHSEQIEHKDSWLDVYVASRFHPRFSKIMADDERIKAQFGGSYDPLKSLLPGHGFDTKLKAAMDNVKPWFNMTSFRRTLIANLVIANNDMHLGIFASSIRRAVEMSLIAAHSILVLPLILTLVRSTCRTRTTELHTIALPGVLSRPRHVTISRQYQWNGQQSRKTFGTKWKA